MKEILPPSDVLINNMRALQPRTLKIVIIMRQMLIIAFVTKTCEIAAGGAKGPFTKDWRFTRKCPNALTEKNWSQTS